jgi:hypothetical protein
MNVDRIVMAFAGTVILASVLLSIYHNVNWLWLTGFCPLATILKKMGKQPGPAF